MKANFLAFFLSINIVVFAQNSVPSRVKQFNLEKGLAIKVYDPVAYFTQKKAVKGTAKIFLNQEGVTYYFVSESNKKTFESNPLKYEPQYGGWCAYAMGDNGEKVEINPETFKIVDGKLYLFYNKLFVNTLKSWNKDENNLKQKADKNWINLTK